ncbi:MAG: TonB-dependent receptor, partial [Oricola sp.]|nr:TonB-dependent receptor [Oricola sp.]
APVGVLLAAVWTAFQSCALGQTPPEPPRSGAESASEDDAVIVVAQRRQEEIGDVPIQITAFTEQEILDAGINSTQDFLDLTPNVILDDSFSYLNTFVNIRGVAQINNADSPVAVVVDGVAQNNQRQLKMSLFDIRQIEVLKGPQGALYGRNASGGAIVISTNPPGSDYEGFASAAYASGGRVETAASVGGAIVEDRALFRLAGAYLSDDGRIDNVFLGETADYIDHDFSIRGRLTLVPAGWLQVDARASYNEFRAGALADSFVPSGDAGDYQAPSTNLRGKSDGEIFETSLKWDADLGFAVLTGVSGYADLREDNVGDIDFSNPVNNPAGAFGAGQLGQTSILDTQLTSQEIRLVSPGDAPVRWIVGGYYLDTDFRAPATLFFDLVGGLAQANDPSLVLLRQDFEEDRDTWSVFAQADVDITSRLTAGAALRYDEDKRVQSDLLSDFSRSASFDSLQPRFTLRYA